MTDTKPDDTEALLAKLGVKDKKATQKNEFARILLLAPSKVGKTTAIAGTAPKPLIINCDGKSTTKGAESVYGDKCSDFMTYDCHTKNTVRDAWKKAPGVAKQLVEKGLVRTIAVDTALLLQDNLLREISLKLDNFDKWNAVEEEMVEGIKQLCSLPAHIFIVSHITPSKEDMAAGVMPGIKGQAKLKIPALIDDWVLLDINVDGTTPKRQFVLGPQKTWSASGRNIKRSTVTEPTVPALFEELGLTL